MEMRDAVEFYLNNNFRPIPLFGPSHGCQCGHDCRKMGGQFQQCIGKVPIDPEWANKELFTPDEFPEGCNVALAMGKQQNGKWLVGIDIDGDINIEDFYIFLLH